MSMNLRYTKWTGAKELLARLVPPESRVLDIGCSGGVLGAELVRRKQCVVLGIDSDDTSTRAAAAHYERVFVGDIQSPFELPDEYLGGFDVLIFGDVLEHLLTPQTALRQFQRYLKPGGIVLISIPNVANWMNRLLLLMGRWEYEDCGILDRTHLRFYTYPTAQRLVEDAGLHVDRVVCTSGLHALDLAAGFRNPANLWKGLLAFQFVFVARRASGDPR